MDELARRTPEMPAPASPPPEIMATAFLLQFSSPRTRESYATDLRDWFGWCAARSLDVLSARRGSVELYARELEQERALKPATVARRLSTLAGFYKYAVIEGGLDRSPLEHVKRPRLVNESPTLGLDRTEAKAMLDAAAASSSRDHALICLLVENGLRVTEACSLQVADLDRSQGHRTISIQGKGGRHDVAPLFPRTANAIDVYLDGRSEGPILLDNEGAPLDRHDAARIVKRLARRAGITKWKQISPHSLRHTFVTQSLKAGAPLHIVQDAARHADPRTTRRYDRAARGLDEHATYTLGAYLEAAGS